MSTSTLQTRYIFLVVAEYFAQSQSELALRHSSGELHISPPLAKKCDGPLMQPHCICTHAAWWLAGTADPAAKQRPEMLECWHLTADEMSALTKECLLPLAEMHAALGLAQSLQPERALAVAQSSQQTGR